MELLSREEQPDGAEEAGERWDENGRDTELLGQPRGVDRARPAVGKERKVTGISSFLGGDTSQGTHHSRVRESIDAARALDHREREWLGDPLNRRTGECRGTGDLAIRDRADRHVAEHDVRIGHRRLDPAAVVAGGPGLGARAPRPDLEAASRVEPRDASAAGPDLGDVDRGDAEELTASSQETASGGERTAGFVLPAPGDGAVLDQRRLCGRPAHVERDHVLPSEPARDRQGGDDAGRRPRLEGEDRAHPGVGRGHDAAGGLHDHHGRADLPSRQATSDVVEIDGDQGLHVRIDGSCGRPLVLALLAQDVARERHADARQFVAEDRADFPLVLREEVRLQEADRDRLGPGLAEPPGDLSNLARNGRTCDRPVRIDPLADFEDHVPRDEWRRLPPEEVVHLWHSQATQLEDVSETGGRDEGGSASTPLEHCIGGDRRPVDDLVDAGVGPRPACQRADRLDDGLVVARRRRQPLRDERPTVAVLEDHVRERPSDIGSDATGHGRAHPVRDFVI